MKQFIIILLVTVIIIQASASDTCAGDGKSIKKRSTDKSLKHYNIILVGATGNLASKYLWKALFDIFQRRFQKEEVRFQIYGAARQDQDEGRKFISDIFLNHLKCSDDECREKKKRFVESSQYVRLKTERDFQNLASMLDENTQSIYGLSGSPVTYEEGRLVYLSIPPSSYTKTSKFVNQYLRPKIGRPWFRVVFEKPFGQDIKSAKNLATDLAEHFDEQEIYRIDHYLGKVVVKQILPFRYINKDTYEPFWNREHVERVDIVMKERDDVIGRTGFYNNVGIIRDVMQNHLTEMMALIAMDLPENSGNISDILQSKVRLLNQVQAPNQHSILTAQYSTYNREWLKEQKLTTNTSKTPTFGASVLFIDNERWNGVPFVLMSGKKLDEKFSYIRVLFKNSRFCMRGADEKCNQQKQLIFIIGGTTLKLPSMIAVSQSLPTPAVKAGWSVRSAKTNLMLFGQNTREMIQLVPDEEPEPYLELISAVIDGSRHLFVSTEMVLTSWKIWTPIIEIAEHQLPRQYMGLGKDAERLDFVVTSKGLYYQLNDKDVFTSVTLTSNHAVYSVIPSYFRNSTLIAGNKSSIFHTLVLDIARLSKEAVADKGVFHLALPGGQTPVPILQLLSEMNLPWASIHIWMVDERCVPLSSDQSNFKIIEHHLLSKVKIPYRNIHPVPVHLDDEPCSKESIPTDEIYENQIHKIVGLNPFDFIVLGVGNDGHIASLFPGQASLVNNDRLVTYTEAESHPLKRVTLTYAAINKARTVAILIFGSSKHDIVNKISNSTDSSTYPVLGVTALNGTLKWYIDHDALYGDSNM